jgi:hypothetical protein
MIAFYRRFDASTSPHSFCSSELTLPKFGLLISPDSIIFTSHGSSVSVLYEQQMRDKDRSGSQSLHVEFDLQLNSESWVVCAAPGCTVSTSQTNFSKYVTTLISLRHAQMIAYYSHDY